MLVCSFSGEWLKPLLIGKSSNPRVFKNVDLNTHNVIYKTNKSSWLTRGLFEEYIYISILNRNLAIENRKILILCDNFSGHMIENKSNIEFMFFPPNYTSVIQPLDMGIIFSFKKKFKQMLTNYMVYCGLNNRSDYSTSIKKINLLNVVIGIPKSLKLVTVTPLKTAAIKQNFLMQLGQKKMSFLMKI
ncbi:Tigger transposable element-derived protein 6 [Dictyocoela muelleri]|nr:Tigger transposable element-derived protein 6 [Dictyocoela muelleri]